MSFTKEALQHVQETAHLPEVIDQLSNASTEIPVAMVPNSMSIESLEQFMPNAARMRLKFSTTSIEDFVAYGKENKEENTTCFVDAEAMDAKIIFDLGTLTAPGHKQHTSNLQLNRTAIFKALISVDGLKQGQKQAAEFIEDWANDLAIMNKAGDQMNLQASVKALLDMTIETAREVGSKVSDFGESMTAMEKIEAKNQDSLPSEILFSCVPYSGLGIRDFKLRVSVLTGGDRPSIVYRIIGLESIIESIAEEFKDKLCTAFDGADINTYIGNA